MQLPETIEVTRLSEIAQSRVSVSRHKTEDGLETIKKEESVPARGRLKRYQDPHRYVSPYGPPQYTSPPRDICPPLATTCPTCLDKTNQLPYDICYFPIVLKVLLLSPPRLDGYGRICGKLGLLSAPGKTDIRQFRRLLRFSLKDSCACTLKSSQQYFLVSQFTTFLKDGQTFSKISLSDQAVLIPVDRYTEAEILRHLQGCSRATFQPTSPPIQHQPPPIYTQSPILVPIPSPQQRVYQPSPPVRHTPSPSPYIDPVRYTDPPNIFQPIQYPYASPPYGKHIFIPPTPVNYPIVGPYIQPRSKDAMVVISSGTHYKYEPSSSSDHQQASYVAPILSPSSYNPQPVQPPYNQPHYESSSSNILVSSYTPGSAYAPVSNHLPVPTYAPAPIYSPEPTPGHFPSVTYKQTQETHPATKYTQVSLPALEPYDSTTYAPPPVKITSIPYIVTDPYVVTQQSYAPPPSESTVAQYNPYTMPPYAPTEAPIEYETSPPYTEPNHVPAENSLPTTYPKTTPKHYVGPTASPPPYSAQNPASSAPPPAPQTHIKQPYGSESTPYLQPNQPPTHVLHPTYNQLKLPQLVSPLFPVISRCLLQQQTCPKACAAVAGKVNFNEAYCNADYAYVAAVTLPDRSALNKESKDSNSPGLCFQLKTKLLHDVSKNVDPKWLNIDLSLLLPSRCSCFPQEKGPAVVVLLGFLGSQANHPATELTENFDLFLLPVHTQTALPLCERPKSTPVPFKPVAYPPQPTAKPYIIPTPPYRMTHPAPHQYPPPPQQYSPPPHRVQSSPPPYLQPPARYEPVDEPPPPPVVYDERNLAPPDAYVTERFLHPLLPATSTDCPPDIKDSCPVCFTHLDQALKTDFCSGKTNFLSELRGAGPYITSYGIPVITFQSTKVYEKKLVLISVSDPLPKKCIQGSLKFLQTLARTEGGTSNGILSIAALADCVCPPLTSTPGTRILISTSVVTSYLSNGALQLTKDYKVVALAPNDPIPTCRSSPSPGYNTQPFYKQNLSYNKPQSNYTLPVDAQPPVPVVAHKPPPNYTPPVYKQVHVYSHPTPEQKTLQMHGQPSPPYEPEQHPVLNEVYSPHPEAIKQPNLSVYPPAPDAAHVPQGSIHGHPSPPFYNNTPAPMNPQPHVLKAGAPVYDPPPSTYNPAPTYNTRPLYDLPLGQYGQHPNNAYVAASHSVVTSGTCPQPQSDCPSCSSKFPDYFNRFYCMSNFAMIVAIGLNYDATVLREKEEPRLLTFYTERLPGIDILFYDNNKFVNLTVTPARAYERARANSHIYDNSCYYEKIRFLYDVTTPRSSSPVFEDWTVHLPNKCTCETFDQSPAYGILLSVDRYTDLKRPIQLSERFAFFPLTSPQITLPECTSESYGPPPYAPSPSSVTKYNAPNYVFQGRDVTCAAHTCGNCGYLYGEYEVPCSAKFAALVQVIETSAGPYVAPTLEILKYTSERNVPAVFLNITTNIAERYSRAYDGYGASEDNRNCKYAVVKVIQDLSPGSDSVYSDKDYGVLTLVAGRSCDCHVFERANGYALLISDKPVAQNSVIQLDGTTVKCIPTGTTKISLCPFPETVSYPPPPPPTKNKVFSHLEPVTTSDQYLEAKSNPYAAPAEGHQDPGLINHEKPLSRPITDLYSKPYAVTHSPVSASSAISYITDNPTPMPPNPYNSNNAPYGAPSTISYTTDNPAPMPPNPYNSNNAPYGPPPDRPPPHDRDSELNNQLPPACQDHRDNSCPVCQEVTHANIGHYDYCNAKLTLVARATGDYKNISPCISGSMISLYDVTSGKGAEKAVLNVLFTIPSHCHCPILEGHRFLIMMINEDITIPLSNPLILHLSSFSHLHPLFPGKLTLPSCENDYPTWRTVDTPSRITVDSVDNELKALLPTGKDLEQCPSVDHSCPKCENLEDNQVQQLICSSDEALLVKTMNESSGGLNQRRQARVTVTQNIAENYTVDISLKPYEYEDVCSLPLKEGKCNSISHRYYYDTEYEVCLEFDYTGCDGNANNFKTEDECENVCMENDYCEAAEVMIKKVYKSDDSEKLANDSFTYSLPEQCECPSLQRGDELVYLVYNTSTNAGITQLTKDYNIITLSEGRQLADLKCESEVSSPDPEDSETVATEPDKLKKKSGGWFG